MVQAPREDGSRIHFIHKGRQRIVLWDAHRHVIPLVKALKRWRKKSSAKVSPGLGERTSFPPAVNRREIKISMRGGESSRIDQGMSPPGVHKANASHGRVVNGLDCVDEMLALVGVNKHMEGIV